MAGRDIDCAGRKSINVIKTVSKFKLKSLTIMAPTINSDDRMIVMHKFTIKMILITDGEIQSSKIWNEVSRQINWLPKTFNHFVNLQLSWNQLVLSEWW